MSDDIIKPGSPAGVTGPGRSGLPVLPPLAAIAEILVLVVLPGLLDHFVPAFPSINETQPHFFWLPVILLTVQYGTVSGLLAAGASILLSALLGWPEQEIGENHFSYLLRIGLQPVLWMTAAIILGQFRLRQIERKEALVRAVTELTAQRQSIAEHARNLRGRCDALERLIAARPVPEASRLLAAMGRVQSPHPPEAAAALHEAIGLGFGGGCVSIWVNEGGALRLADRHGTSPVALAHDVLGASEPITRAVLEQGRQLSVLEVSEERELGGLGLAGVPISGADRRITGMLLLEHAQPEALDSTTTARLAALALVVGDRMRAAQATVPFVPRPLLVPVLDVPKANPIGRYARWRAGARRGRASGRPG